jgi:hypothetical protein
MEKGVRRMLGSTVDAWSPRRILEAELSWIPSLVLFFLSIYFAIRGDVLWTVYGITVMTLYVLPMMSKRSSFAALPWDIMVILVVPAAVHAAVGSAWLDGDPMWMDAIASLSFSLSMATIGMLLSVEIQMYTDVRMNSAFAVFFIVMFTLAVSGFWQVGIFLGDELYGTDNQGSNYDVMLSLSWSLVGGVLMAFVYYAYLKAMSEDRRRTLGFMHLWEAGRSRNG